MTYACIGRRTNNGTKFSRAAALAERQHGVISRRQLRDLGLIPTRGEYEHNRLNHDSNSHAHQRATLIGPSEAIPILAGGLALGTWQQLVLIDFDDRPRERTVVVQILS